MAATHGGGRTAVTHGGDTAVGTCRPVEHGHVEGVVGGRERGEEGLVDSLEHAYVGGGLGGGEDVGERDGGEAVEEGAGGADGQRLCARGPPRVCARRWR